MTTFAERRFQTKQMQDFADSQGLEALYNFDTDSLIVGIRFTSDAIVRHPAKVADMIQKLSALVKGGKLD